MDMQKRIFELILFLLLPFSAMCQKIDHMVSFRDIQSERYFRFNYDNDFFAAADKNYTQGYALEFMLPILERNPVNYIFLKPKNSVFRYGMALEHIGYTPNDYVSAAIQVGDRPFASAIMLKSFIIAVNDERKDRISQSLSLGLIGPSAFGKEMQVGIHRAIGDKIPGGWDNQIANDFVLNYRIAYEKQLYRFRNTFALQADIAAQLGTLFTNASVGVNTTMGLLDNPFDTARGKTNFVIYAYAHPMVNSIGYDATLQGGLLNTRSIYTINGNAIERFTANLEYGIVIKTRTLYFEYTRTSITREYATENSAKWGGVKIGFTF